MFPSIGGERDVSGVRRGPCACVTRWRGDCSILPGQHALAFQLLHQRGGLPHAGGGEVVQGHEVVGFRSFSLETCYLLFGRR